MVMTLLVTTIDLKGTDVKGYHSIQTRCFPYRALYSTPIFRGEGRKWITVILMTYLSQLLTKAQGVKLIRPVVRTNRSHNSTHPY